MSSSVPLIKERLSIVDVISSYITVEESGKNYKAKCPFHNEKTPSFFISSDRNSYYCFGCGAKGDIFSFVENFEGTDFKGALKILASRAGVNLDEFKNESNDDKETLYKCMEDATVFFEKEFVANPEARLYLKDRGISDESITKFRIGYVKNTWRSLSDYLIRKGYHIDDLEKVGLVKKTEKGTYDRFRGRIMFPICDSTGRTIAFSGRIFGRPDDEEAKYLNSPDTILFNKSNVLFGIDKAKGDIRKRGYSIVVEGQMDLVLSHQAGFTNTVAVSGTALADHVSDNQDKVNNLGLIRRLSSNVIFAFDGDSAGIRACGRSAMIALGLDMQVKVAILPEGQDPADIIKTNPDTWKNIIKNSVNIVTFHLDKINAMSTDIKIKGRKIREILFPYLSMMRSAIDRDSYIQEIHQKTGVSIHAIQTDFSTFESTQGSEKIPENKEVQKDPALSRKDQILKRLFGVYFWQEENADFEKFRNEFKKIIEENTSESFLSIKSPYDSFAESISFEAEMWYGDKIDKALKESKEMMLNLEETLLQEKLHMLMNEIKEAPTEKNILTQYQKIVQRIQDIKNSRSK